MTQKYKVRPKDWKEVKNWTEDFFWYGEVYGEEITIYHPHWKDCENKEEKELNKTKLSKTFFNKHWEIIEENKNL